MAALKSTGQLVLRQKSVYCSLLNILYTAKSKTGSRRKGKSEERKVGSGNFYKFETLCQYAVMCLWEHWGRHTLQFVQNCKKVSHALADVESRSSPYTFVRGGVPVREDTYPEPSA